MDLVWNLVYMECSWFCIRVIVFRQDPPKCGPMAGKHRSRRVSFFQKLLPQTGSPQRQTKCTEMIHKIVGRSGFFFHSEVKFSTKFLMPPDRDDRGHIVIVLSICLSVCLSVWSFVCLFVVNFNLRYNFWTVRDRNLIFSMHTQVMMPFQMTPRSLWPWLWSLC